MGVGAALVLALTLVRGGTLEAGTGMAEVTGKVLREKGNGEVGVYTWVGVTVKAALFVCVLFESVLAL